VTGFRSKNSGPTGTNNPTEHRTRRLVKQLEGVGHTVTLELAA